MSALTCKVASIIDYSPFLRTIRFDLLGQSFSFYPGQYVMVGVDLAASDQFKVLHGKEAFQERPFSISSNPLLKDAMDITIVNTKDGFMADYFLNYITPGSEVEIKGPFGNNFFDEKNANKNVMLIGGGSGVMPLVSIATYVAEKNLPNRVHMLFSFKNQEKIILGDSIEKACRNNNITNEVTLTQESWSGTMGRINKAMIDSPGFDPVVTDYYVCGPQEFKQNMERVLREECGVPVNNIHQ